MISKAKMNRITKGAGATIRFLDCIPLEIQKKLKAEQVVSLCDVLAQVERRAFESANAERMAHNVARFHPSAWTRRLKDFLSAGKIELPRLAIGVAAVRARFGK